MCRLVEVGFDSLASFLGDNTMGRRRRHSADCEGSERSREARVGDGDVERDRGQEALRLVGDRVGQRGLVNPSMAVGRR